MRVPVAALAACAISACAAAPEAAPTAPAGQDDYVTNGNDCAVIAAVAKGHYRFNTTDNVPPPLWLDAEGTDWAPRCDWSRYGLAFPATHDPDRVHRPGDRIQWVSFKRPRYDGSGALIDTGILHGPLAGIGHECRIRSGFAGWTVDECRSNWIS